MIFLYGGEPDLTGYKSLGYMNEWVNEKGNFNPPEEYKKCTEQEHEATLYRIGRMHELWVCKICKIYWYVDTSE